MRLWLLGLLFAAQSAMADVPRPAAAPATPLSPGFQTVPQSVWRTADDGQAEHLQSGLKCPIEIDGFVRNQLYVFDAFGLDVSCNYKVGPADITLYLTRRGGMSVEAIMAAAKRDLLQVGAARHPTLLSETRSSDDGLDGLVAFYAEDGDVHSGIWMADLNGWTLEYRATYPARAEGPILADIRAMTAFVQASAGAQLARCAGSSPPPRDGKILSGQRDVENLAMMSGLLGGAVLAAAQDGKATPAPSPEWCAESPVTVAGRSMLAWRSVTSDAEGGGFDQLTLMTDGPPPTLVIAPVDPIVALTQPKVHAPRWVASMDDDGRTLFFAYFTGRPPTQIAAELFADILAGKAKPVGGVAAKGKSITIMAPGSH